MKLLEIQYEKRNKEKQSRNKIFPPNSQDAR